MVTVSNKGFWQKCSLTSVFIFDKLGSANPNRKIFWPNSFAAVFFRLLSGSPATSVSKPTKKIVLACCEAAWQQASLVQLFDEFRFNEATMLFQLRAIAFGSAFRLLSSGLTASGKTQVKGRSDRQACFAFPIAMRSLRVLAFERPDNKRRNDASQKR